MSCVYDKDYMSALQKQILRWLECQNFFWALFVYCLSYCITARITSTCIIKKSIFTEYFHIPEYPKSVIIGQTFYSWVWCFSTDQGQSHIYWEHKITLNKKDTDSLVEFQPLENWEYHNSMENSSLFHLSQDLHVCVEMTRESGPAELKVTSEPKGEGMRTPQHDGVEMVETPQEVPQGMLHESPYDCSSCCCQQKLWIFK